MADSDKLRMKFKLHGLEFEIEGKEEVVKEEFENFKTFITGDLLPNVNVSNPPQQSIQQETPARQISGIQDTTAIEVSDFPVLKEVVKKDLPKTETDWILVFAFYASSFAENTFTEENIKEHYQKTGRKNDSRMKNLSNNIKSLLKKEFIKVHNDTEYLLKQEGIDYAQQILEGQSSSKTSTKSSSKSKTKSGSSASNKGSGNKKKAVSTQDFKLDRNLNLRPDGKKSLIDFAKGYKIDSAPKRILLIVYYLKEILSMDAVNSNHIYTGFDGLNVRVPKSLYQLISDTKNKNGWLDFETMEDIGLSIQGKNAMKFDLINEDA